MSASGLPGDAAGRAARPGHPDEETDMVGTIHRLHPERPKRVLMVASNPATSPQTGWPIGFWWAELTHPWWVFAEAGYEVTVASPDGGALHGDAWSDPRDESGYSADDLISLGFVTSNAHRALVETTPSLDDVTVTDHDAVFLVGGQGPMVTFRKSPKVEAVVREAFDSGMATAVVCHATCVLLDVTTGDGEPVVRGRTWTGFANSEEDYADAYVGRAIQPFRIEDEARALPDTTFVVHSRFTPFAIRDGNLITGQQQHSGAAAARLVVEALGV